MIAALIPLLLPIAYVATIIPSKNYEFVSGFTKQGDILLSEYSSKGDHCRLIGRDGFEKPFLPLPEPFTPDRLHHLNSSGNLTVVGKNPAQEKVVFVFNDGKWESISGDPSHGYLYAERLGERTVVTRQTEKNGAYQTIILSGDKIQTLAKIARKGVNLISMLHRDGYMVSEKVADDQINISIWRAGKETTLGQQRGGLPIYRMNLEADEAILDNVVDGPGDVGPSLLYSPSGMRMVYGPRREGLWNVVGRGVLYAGTERSRSADKRVAICQGNQASYIDKLVKNFEEIKTKHRIEGFFTHAQAISGDGHLALEAYGRDLKDESVKLSFLLAPVQ